MRYRLTLATILIVAACSSPMPVPSSVVSPILEASASPSASPAVDPTPTAKPRTIPAFDCPEPGRWTETDPDTGLQVPITPVPCRPAVFAASRVLPDDLVIDRVGFGFGRYCPVGARCAASLPTQGYVVFYGGAGGPSFLVNVSVDGQGGLSALPPEVFPPP